MQRANHKNKIEIYVLRDGWGAFGKRVNGYELAKSAFQDFSNSTIFYLGLMLLEMRGA